MNRIVQDYEEFSIPWPVYATSALQVPVRLRRVMSSMGDGRRHLQVAVENGHFEVASAPPDPTCYHPATICDVTSTKKQTQVRLEEDVLAAGKAAAAARRLDFNRYVERLIIEDTTGARAAGMAAAQRLIDEHGTFLDDLEEQLDAPYAEPQPGAAA